MSVPYSKVAALKASRSHRFLLQMVIVGNWKQRNFTWLIRVDGRVVASFNPFQSTSLNIWSDFIKIKEGTTFN